MAPPATEQTSGFFRLPGEIRNTIYRLVLADPNKQIMITPQHIRKKTALLRTCHLLRDEASSIFYAENVFRIRVPLYENKRLLSWLRIIGHEHADRIARLVVTFGKSAKAVQLCRCLYALRERQDGEITTLFNTHLFERAGRDLATVVLFRGVRATAVDVQSQHTHSGRCPPYCVTRPWPFQDLAEMGFRERVAEEL